MPKPARALAAPDKEQVKRRKKMAEDLAVIPIRTVAVLYGVGASDIRKLMEKDQGFRQLVENYRTLARKDIIAALSGLQAHAQQAANNLIEMADNLEHKDCYKANDRILSLISDPEEQREQGEGGSGSSAPSVNVTLQVLAPLAAEIKRWNTVDAKKIPDAVLLMGEDALPSVED